MLYDLIIIGAGPAGLTAVIYAKRAFLKTLIFEKAVRGGKLNKTAGKSKIIRLFFPLKDLN